MDLGVDLKRAWVQWCAGQATVPGKAIRGLVEATLSAGGQSAGSKPTSPKPKVGVTSEPDRGPKIGREIQFTPSENTAAEAAAAAQGFAFQEWVVAAVRAALAQVPAYGQLELEALTQSNACMAQVAIELGGWRRHSGVEADSAVALRLLETDIRRHVETVSAAMAHGAQRWRLKV